VKLTHSFILLISTSIEILTIVGIYNASQLRDYKSMLNGKLRWKFLVNLTDNFICFSPVIIIRTFTQIVATLSPFLDTNGSCLLDLIFKRASHQFCS